MHDLIRFLINLLAAVHERLFFSCVLVAIFCVVVDAYTSKTSAEEEDYAEHKRG